MKPLDEKSIEGKQDIILGNRTADIRNTRQTASEITTLGVSFHDLLGNEVESRVKTLSFVTFTGSPS